MIDYIYQLQANISSLLEAGEYEERKNCIFKLLKEFDEKEVTYGIGCSFNLFLRGIVDEFHDFDIIIDEKSISIVKIIMKNLGAKLVTTGGNGYCESDVYLHYQLGRVDVDIISGFRVLTYNTKIYYAINPSEIEYCIIYEEKPKHIPLLPLESLYGLYFMMEGWQSKRRFKRVLITEFFENNPLKFPEILERFLNDTDDPLPGFIKREIRRILGLRR